MKLQKVLLFAATIVVAVVRQPNCYQVKEGVFPAQNCDQYYICIKQFWWFTAELHTCPAGQKYSDIANGCVTGSCRKVPKTRNVLPPTCEETGPGVFVAPNCNQYYECVKIWWWYSLNLRSCSPSKVYDPHEQLCVRGKCQ
ncbi:unnamed protein product [Acanthoscelides obtectus]|uniref:Chitin-binding type-2 domain-containing protein n=1 Tax=Acanthoscelides obtectus TaxID=200917 RepID=A0A9P0KMU4_ACAOB|nr:unnamed protein product [Acanthoscelides obtectus]CAK1667735.1 hypothetical protein AOBTE_LOCUS26014 [Acanthoscelides obtectus]